MIIKPDYTTGAPGRKISRQFKNLLSRHVFERANKNLIKPKDKIGLMDEKKVILGLTEEVTLVGDDRKQKLRARIDTGATASSIDVHLARTLGFIPTKELKVVRSASGVKKRPIVTGRIKMDGLVIEAEFTLADRSHMTYPVLIGQNILKKGAFLIDPNKK